MRRVSPFLRMLKSLGPWRKVRKERKGKRKEGVQSVDEGRREKEVTTLRISELHLHYTHLPYLFKLFEWCSVL